MTNSSTITPRRAAAYIVLAASAYGSLSIVTTLAERVGVGMLTLMAWRYAIAAPILFGIAGKRAFSVAPMRVLALLVEPIKQSLQIGDTPHEICETMERAVARAAVEAEAGEVVLLAPAAASFDQYPNFEKRGEDFTARVKSLLG